MTEYYDIYECATFSGFKEYGFHATHIGPVSEFTWWEIIDGTRDGITDARISMDDEGINAEQQIHEYIDRTLRNEYGDPT